MKIGILNNFELLNTKGINPKIWIYLDCYSRVDRNNQPYINMEDMYASEVAKAIGMGRSNTAGGIAKLKEMGILVDDGWTWEVHEPGRTFVKMDADKAKEFLKKYSSRTLLVYIQLLTLASWKGVGVSFTLQEMARKIYNMEWYTGINSNKYRHIKDALDELEEDGAIKYHIEKRGRTFIRVLDYIE